MSGMTEGEKMDLRLKISGMTAKEDGCLMMDVGYDVKIR
jgi:hypothetical protein